jgi:hypothetical protein
MQTGPTGLTFTLFGGLQADGLAWGSGDVMQVNKWESRRADRAHRANLHRFRRGMSAKCGHF